MKFFNKNNDSGMLFGASDIINDETAAIISELGNNKASDDLSFEPAKQAQPKSHTSAQQQTQGQTQTSPQQHTSSSQQTSPKPTQATQQAPQAKTSGPTIKFGIKDAIDLINSLPSENTELVIPVVVKTLESANIHLDEIIEDADKHEKILETRSHRLIEQIEEMEAKVASLSDQVMSMNSQLEEITHVRELLSLSFNDEDDYDHEAAQLDTTDATEAGPLENEHSPKAIADTKSAINNVPIRTKRK